MNTTTELPTLLETLEMVNEYVRDKELFERRQVTFDELRHAFSIGRNDMYQILRILEDRRDVKVRGMDIFLAPRRRPCWIV
jgi:hypothetical protein